MLNEINHFKQRFDSNDLIKSLDTKYCLKVKNSVKLDDLDLIENQHIFYSIESIINDMIAFILAIPNSKASKSNKEPVFNYKKIVFSIDDEHLTYNNNIFNEMFEIIKVSTAELNLFHTLNQMRKIPTLLIINVLAIILILGSLILFIHTNYVFYVVIPLDFVNLLVNFLYINKFTIFRLR